MLWSIAAGSEKLQDLLPEEFILPVLEEDDEEGDHKYDEYYAKLDLVS